MERKLSEEPGIMERVWSGEQAKLAARISQSILPDVRNKLFLFSNDVTVVKTYFQNCEIGLVVERKSVYVFQFATWNIGVEAEQAKIVGPNFRKILRQSYDNFWIFVQHTRILRQIYDITTIVRTLLT